MTFALFGGMLHPAPPAGSTGHGKGEQTELRALRLRHWLIIVLLVLIDVVVIGGLILLITGRIGLN